MSKDEFWQKWKEARSLPVKERFDVQLALLSELEVDNYGKRS